METESRIRSLKKILLALFLFACGIGSVIFIGRMLYGKNINKKTPLGAGGVIMYPAGAKNPETGMKHGVVYAVKGSDGQWKKYVDLHTCGNGHDFWMTYDVSDPEKIAHHVSIRHMTIPLGLSISQKLGAEADFLILLYKMTAEQWCYTTIPSRRLSLWALEKRGEEILPVTIGKEEISLLDRVYGGYGNSAWLSMLTTVPGEETRQ